MDQLTAFQALDYRRQRRTKGTVLNQPTNKLYKAGYRKQQSAKELTTHPLALSTDGQCHVGTLMRAPSCFLHGWTMPVGTLMRA